MQVDDFFLLLGVFMNLKDVSEFLKGHFNINKIPNEKSLNIKN